MLPDRPVIVALELSDARALLKDDTLQWPSGRTVCLDLGLREGRGTHGSSPTSRAPAGPSATTPRTPRSRPAGEQLVQAQMPIRPGESPNGAAARLEQLLDLSFDGWRERVTWRRRQVMDGRSGALDLPGATWRDRPAVDRGDGVFLCGDQVAAHGCLAEVSFASAIEAGRRATEQTTRHTVAPAA